MDKEMKAKVDEFLKTNGRRELSMDEMEQVNGGGSGYAVAADGKAYPEDFVVSLGRSMASEFGYDIAADTLCKMFLISPAEKSMGGGSDIARIDLLINRIFEINEHAEANGKTF